MSLINTPVENLEASARAVNTEVSVAVNASTEDGNAVIETLTYGPGAPAVRINGRIHSALAPGGSSAYLPLDSFNAAAAAWLRTAGYRVERL